jgi:hypothetical protein
MIPTGSIIDLPLPSPFKSRLKFIAMKRDSDGEVFVELLAPLVVKTRCGTIEVPTGFISDGASIPKAVWVVVGDPFEFEYLHAAIIHDALYRQNFLDHITRSQADVIFRDLMWNTEVPFWKIPPFYAAVVSFGWRSYKKVSEISVHPKAIPIPE